MSLETAAIRSYSSSLLLVCGCFFGCLSCFLDVSLVSWMSLSLFLDVSLSSLMLLSLFLDTPPSLLGCLSCFLDVSLVSWMSLSFLGYPTLVAWISLCWKNTIVFVDG